MSRLVTLENNPQTIENIYQYVKDKSIYNYEKYQRSDPKKHKDYTQIFDRTIFLNRLTSSVIEAASANVYSENYFKFQNGSSKQKMLQMYKVKKKPPARLEAIDEEILKSRTNFLKDSAKTKENQIDLSTNKSKENKVFRILLIDF